MDNTAQEFPRISDYLKPRDGGSGNNVTISVVRNVVFNMESVLTDLKDIMGEITSIVDHIDTVTGRMDKDRKAGKDNRDLLTSKFNLGKSLSANYWESKLVKVETAVSPEDDNESATDPSRMPNAHPSKTEIKFKGLSQHQDFLSTKQQKSDGTVNIDGAARLEWKNSSKLLSFSKEFNYLGKHRTGIMPQNGAIAIVHPTIINNLPAMFKHVSTETSVAQKSVASVNRLPVMPRKRSTDISSTQKSLDDIDSNPHRQIFIAGSSFQKCHTSKNDLRCILQANAGTIKDVEEHVTQEKEEQKRGITFDRHIYILPDQKPPVTGAKEKLHSHWQLSKKVCTNLQSVVESSETSTVIKPEEFDTENSSGMKAQFHRGINHTGEVEFLPKRSQPHQDQELMFKSPLMRHSSPKSVYSKVQSSPASVRAPNSKRGCEAKHYYYSTESDADSDSCVEYHDVRSTTPDIDWSYLNLVGDGNAKDNIIMTADTHISKPVISTVDRGVYARHKIADVEDICEERDTRSLVVAKEKFNQVPIKCDYNITGSQVLVHIFCSEASSFEAVGYCGYYEAILDSVLENIAGFQSFEEACDAIENIGILNETYASCDTEFEEDDWDIGMKSGNQDEYPSHSSVIHQHECLHSGSLAFLDSNQNILAANSRNPNMKFESGYENRKIIPVSRGPLEAIGEAPYNNRSKESRPLSADYENQESVKVSATGQYIIDNDNGSITIVSSNLNQNLIFRPESILSSQQHLNKEKIANSIGLESDRSLSDVASCSNDGSPMSFGSSEIASTTQAIDHVESASEEDDLDSSQYDSASLSSELGYDAKMVMHKAKIKRLRREFFLSMYRQSDDKGMEAVDNNYSMTSLDDIVGLGQSLTRLDNMDNVSESESYPDNNLTGYNKSINTWTTYALVDLQTDDVSDSTSDVFSENSSN